MLLQKLQKLQWHLEIKHKKINAEAPETAQFDSKANIVTTFFPAVNKNYYNMMNSSYTASCFWGWPSLWHSQIKYEWKQVMVAKYEFGGLLCHVIPDALKSLKPGKTSGANHPITQHQIPGTCVFSNTTVRTSEFAYTHLLFLHIHQELYKLWTLTNIKLCYLSWNTCFCSHTCPWWFKDAIAKLLVYFMLKVNSKKEWGMWNFILRQIQLATIRVL